MRLVRNCECTDKVSAGWIPTQEQLDCTAPGGDKGYYPGAYCIKPEVCKNITSYDDLKNKPSINGVILEGDKSWRQLELMCRMQAITNAQIDSFFSD